MSLNDYAFVVSALLGLLAALLSIIAGLVIYIFRRFVRQIDELERTVQVAVTRINQSMTFVTSSFLTLHVAVHPEHKERVARILDRLQEFQKVD